jgi:predicted ATPase
MLGRIHIENYKCLRDVTVELGDFTILIGPNDSGKSSFLEVIRNLGKIAQVNTSNLFQGDHSLQNLVWRKKAERHIVWEVTGLLAENRFTYRLELPVHPWSPREWLDWNGKRLFWTDAATPAVQKQYNLPPGAVMLTVETDQGTQVQHAQLDTAYLPQFLFQRQSDFTGLGDAFAPSTEYHFELDKLPHPSVPQPEIVLEPSGGNLLTAFLTLAYTQTASLLLFEEPENGLHPLRLQMVLDILRKMSRGQVGNRQRQIIVTTHNPLLLNYANPEEVRVFVRHPEQGTKVIPMTQVRDIDRLLKEFALGELWYLLGEEKLFEEQPA